MDAFKQLSALTKITLVLMLVAMLMLTLSFLPWMHNWGALGLFLVGGFGLTAALDDPEAEERMPLGVRILVGFAGAAPFALLAWLFQRSFMLINMTTQIK